MIYVMNKSKKSNRFWSSPHWTSGLVLTLAAIFITATCNITMFQKLFDWYVLTDTKLIYILSLVVIQTLLLVLVFSVLTAFFAFRTILATILMISAFSAYFVDSFGVIIDREMLINAIQTDPAEASALFSPRFLLYFMGIFLLPSIFLFKIKMTAQGLLKRLKSNVIYGVGSLALIVAIVFSFYPFYASFFREQLVIRVYSNPMAAMYGVIQVAQKDYFTGTPPFTPIASDAHKPTGGPRKLVIMVVGETARADRFSMNGYARKTNPLLEQSGIISFSDASSCGTSTAYSVPCMFAQEGRAQYNRRAAAYRGNALDVLADVGTHVYWRDNNSDSKDVANRVNYKSFKSPPTNTICDPECRDVGMLVGLDTLIETQDSGDFIFVLHQMGSHGPTYWQRVPDGFQKFQPICTSSQLDQCSPEQINNSYDNTIFYTDYFLAQTIEFLKVYDDRFETTLLYASDHGESLGENGLYLHGMPYSMAPVAQTHVPVMMWLGARHSPIKKKLLLAHADKPISHDNLFHSLLGLFGVETSAYLPQKDLLNSALE